MQLMTKEVGTKTAPLSGKAIPDVEWPFVMTDHEVGKLVGTLLDGMNLGMPAPMALIVVLAAPRDEKVVAMFDGLREACPFLALALGEKRRQVGVDK